MPDRPPAVSPQACQAAHRLRTRSALQQELGAAKPLSAHVFQRVFQKWHASTRGWHSAVIMISKATMACPSVALPCCHVPAQCPHRIQV